MKKIICFILSLTSILTLTSCSAISKLFCDHEYSEWSIVKDATCVETGTQNRICNLCGKTEENTISLKEEHEYNDWVIIKEATCTEEGDKEQACKHCQNVQKEKISVIEHNWKDATCTSPKTCQECNATYGTNLDHSWKTATCTVAQKCSRCNITQGEALGHTWKDATCTSAKRCITCNAIQGNALGHKWKDATCTSAKKCSVCGTTEGSALSHTSNSKGKCKYCSKKMTAKDFDYLAGTDFRRIRNSYSSATAQGAYVIVYTNLDGDICVLTYVRYKIVSNYSETTLHNITKGTYISNPSNYYDTLASRAWGDSRIRYMELESEVRLKELYAMQGVSDALSKGSHSGVGAFVDATTLNM